MTKKAEKKWWVQIPWNQIHTDEHNWYYVNNYYVDNNIVRNNVVIAVHSDEVAKASEGHYMPDTRVLIVTRDKVNELQSLIFIDGRRKKIVECSLGFMLSEIDYEAMSANGLFCVADSYEEFIISKVIFNPIPSRLDPDVWDLWLKTELHIRLQG